MVRPSLEKFWPLLTKLRCSDSVTTHLFAVHSASGCTERTRKVAHTGNMQVCKLELTLESGAGSITRLPVWTRGLNWCFATWEIFTGPYAVSYSRRLTFLVVYTIQITCRHLHVDKKALACHHRYWFCAIVLVVFVIQYNALYRTFGFRNSIDGINSMVGH